MPSSADTATDEPKLISITYPVQGQPPVEDATAWATFGPLTVGVEYRHVDAANVAASFEGNERYETFADQVPADLDLNGYSVHLNGTEDGHEYLRFDLFVERPHYHYFPKYDDPSKAMSNMIDFDEAAHGPMLPWLVETVATRIPSMLRCILADDLASAIEQLDMRAVAEHVEAACAAS